MRALSLLAERIDDWSPLLSRRIISFNNQVLNWKLQRGEVEQEALVVL